jgi:hypothetical protein
MLYLCIYEFVLTILIVLNQFVYKNNSQKKSLSDKKGVPLDPQVCGNTYKSVLRTRGTHVKKDTICTHTLSFVVHIVNP